MSANLNVGKFAGIRVQIHWSFWLLILWIVYREISRGRGLETILWSSGFIFVLFLCVVLHEYGHALTARRYGVKTNKITLLPIGGVADLEQMPRKPMQEFWVAIAGPLVNVTIALLLYFFVPFETILDQSQEELRQTLNSIGPDNFIFYLFSTNVILVLFNLLPAFPMDGGRVLRALLSLKMSRLKATKVASSIGQFLAAGLFFFGLFYSPILILIGIFVFFGAQSESSMIQQQSLLEGYRVKDAMRTGITKVKPDQTLDDIVELLISGAEKNFIVEENNEIRGILYHDELIKSFQSHDRNTAVREVMNTNYDTLGATENLTTIFKKMKTSNKTFFPVVDGKETKGAIDNENLNEFIAVKAMLEGNE